MPVVLDADGHLALPGLAGQPTRSARALASARGRGQAVTLLPGRARRLLCAAARLAAVVACLGGLPYALARLAGWPLPRDVSSFTRLPALLAAPVSDQEILKIVACVVWLAWVIFALSVIAEVAAAARGRPTPQLPGTGPVQALAAALLGTTVLTAIMQASPLAALPATLTAHAAPAAQTQPARSRPAASAAPARPASARHAAADHGMGSQHRTPRARIYRVVEGDNLWDIAERYLGDGQRWHEIFALNQGRPQPDGQELTDPNLIKPGWVLRLPLAPLTRPAPAGHAQVPQPTSPAHPPARSQAPPHAARARPRAFTQHHRAENGGPGISLPSGGLAGIGLAAAVTTALVLTGVRRRRRYRPGHGLSSSLKPAWAHLPPAIATLRRAAASQRPATANAAANADPGQPSPAAVPADTAGPADRSKAQGQAAAQATAIAGRSGDAAGGPEPPGCVITLGVRDGHEIRADIAALGGLGLTGPGAPAAARAILAGLLARAVPGHGSGPAEVIVPAADLAVLLPGWHPDVVARSQIPGLIVTRTVDAALSHAEAILVRRARIAEQASDSPPGATSAPAHGRADRSPFPGGHLAAARRTRIRPRPRPGRDPPRRLATRCHLPRRRRRHPGIRRSRPGRRPAVPPRRRRHHSRGLPAASSLHRTCHRRRSPPRPPGLTLIPAR